MLLKWILKEKCVKVWREFSCLKNTTLVNTEMKFRASKIAKEILAFR